MKAALEGILRETTGIKSVSANPLTGNLLVTFDQGHDADSVAAKIARARDIAAERNGARASLSNGLAKAPAKRSPKPRVSGKPLTRIKRAVGEEESEQIAWHSMDAAEVVALTRSSLSTGLSSSAVIDRLATYGPNVLPESEPRSRLAILLNQLSSTPILLLMAAAGMSVMTGGLLDAAIILGVVGINAAIGYVTENQSERTIRSLENVVAPSAVVIRDGKPQEVPALEVTPGDLLMLSPGSYVAADGRLVEVDRLSVDESALTGESVPAIKTADRTVRNVVPMADRHNMVHMGTLVTGGQGLAVVVATGRHTEVGRIQALATLAETPQTPLQRQLNRMGRQLAVLVTGVCIGIFGIGLLRGFPFVSMLQTSIALAVAAVPEGLPTIATTILALGILRMRNLRVLVRRLDAVETLGSVQAICLDKTGTLTLNRMSAVSAYTDGRSFAISNGDFRESGQTIDPNSDPQLQQLLDSCVLCSETLIEKHDRTYTLKGSPTENALIHAAIAANRDVLNLRDRYPTLKVRFRSEDRSFMSTVHRQLSHNGNEQFITFVKGSPEQVLAMCVWEMRQSSRVELSNERRRVIQTENERMAGNGLRVLACARREDDSEPANNHGPEGGLVWLGLMGLADPIREGMEEVIRGFHAAGIDTIMITGDQSPTAFAISSQLHLSRNGPLQILDSTNLAKMDPEIMKGLAEKIHVFARVSPSHKLQIVRALQQANKVVAMTGDGINDSPALKAADIGIAMGTGGTDVAREVADVVLGDDQLQTMLVAVSQGRTIYSNIRKSVHFLLSTNLSEVLVMFVAMAAGLGQPLSAMQLLWINLVSETSLGLALALDPPEPGVMTQPPRDPNEPIIRPQDLKRMGFEALTLSTGSLAAYGYGVGRYGIGPQASTVGFTSLVSGQILHALSSRSERYTIFNQTPREPNRILTQTVGGSLVLQASIFLMPWLMNLLGVTSITFTDALMASAGALLPLFVNEGAKKVVFQTAKNQPGAIHPQLR
jgi:Ca2+-transporting ATPase